MKRARSSRGSAIMRWYTVSTMAETRCNTRADDTLIALVLFYEETKKGNASLRLDRITLDDAGEYTCSVSTQVGSQKKSFGLRVAAYYPEPHLHISLLNDDHREVLVTSEGGYPSSSLQWLMGSASDVTNDTDTQL